MGDGLDPATCSVCYNHVGHMASLVDSQALLSFINLDGGFAAQIASTVVAGTAKSIELALATIFVTFLGQVLSRDALDVRSSITLADMQLKMVLLQPGSVISKFSSYRRTTKALLGLPTMLAALVAMIYTTASDTLGMSLESFLKSKLHVHCEYSLSTVDAPSSRQDVNVRPSQ